MESLPLYVGLDYHMNSVQVCLMDERGKILSNRSVGNDWREIAATALPFGRPVRAAIESCNGASDLAEELIARAEWSVSLAHPGYVSRMKQNPDKTDWQDARMLADLERVGYLPRVWLAPEHVRELRRLVRYRTQLAEQRRSTKLRLSALLREQRVKPPAGVNPWTKAWREWTLKQAEISREGRWVIEQHWAHLDYLKERIKAAEERLRAATRDDPVVARLMAQPGIGEVTAWTLRAEIGRFDRFRSGKQLARFCGLSPCNASSGDRQADAGLIKAANRDLRAVLIEAAHRLAMQDPRWKELRDRLRQAGKSGSVAAAAVANRWVRGLFHQFREAM